MKHCCCCFCDLATDLERFRTLEKYKMQGRRFVNPSDQNMTCVYLGTFKTTGDYLVRFYYYGQQIFLRTQNNMVRVFPQQSTRGRSSRCFQWKRPMLLALLPAIGQDFSTRQQKESSWLFSETFFIASSSDQPLIHLHEKLASQSNGFTDFVKSLLNVIISTTILFASLLCFHD